MNRNYCSSGFRRFALMLFAVLLHTAGPATAQEAVCAVVKIEIQQELTLERQAFDAMMRINNSLDNITLEDVRIDVNFADEAGNPVIGSSDPNNLDAAFFVRVDSMDGITDISGTGMIPPQTSAEIHWLIVPAPGAGGELPSGKLYFVGARLSYRQGGELEEMDVAPDSIFVKPLPSLTLDYFLTHDVYADDPFTSEVEPAEPFTLGVRVRNDGHAPAHQLRIDSAQPTIVENEQGLQIGFTIIGSSIDDQARAPTLLIDFGSIGPQASRVGRWDMVTTLSGRFTEFSAEFSHADELGGQLTSLIEAANTHLLVHDVLVDLPARDPVRDFLALDGEVLRVYESDSVDTEVTDQSAAATLQPAGSSGDEHYFTLSVPPTAGFVYVQFDDPFQGTKLIERAVRNDGKRLPVSNAWLSKKRKQDLSWARFGNVFDVNSTGQYILTFVDAPQEPAPPALDALAPITTWETNPTGFAVTATDPNGTTPALSAEGLPGGASFVDQGNGTGVFTWTPTVGQAGIYTVVFRASDGVLEDTQSVTIRVNPAWDTDGDGLDDAWELEHFGNLERDGIGDFDGDGISDLEEYLRGDDPTLPAPAVPIGFSGMAGDGSAVLSWQSSEGATGYHLYWSVSPGVTPADGAKLEAAASPYRHSGLTNGQAYYYIVTASGPGGESVPSVEVEVSPGLGEWGTPVRIDAGEASAHSHAVAKDGGGNAMAVWVQSDGTHERLWAARYLLEGGWQTPVAIDGSSTGDAAAPQVQMDAAGNAMVVWQHAEGGVSHIRANHFLADSGWGTATSIDSAEGQAGDPHVALDGSGNAAAVWPQGEGLWFNRYDAQAAAWGIAAPVATALGDAFGSASIAADGDGNLMAAWTQTRPGEGFDVYAARYTHDNGWNAPHPLALGATGGALAPDLVAELAMAPDGRAVVVWAHSDGQNNAVWAARYAPDTGWTAPERLGSPSGDAYAPKVALGGDQRATVAWLHHDGSRTSAWATRDTDTGGWETAALLETDDTADAGALQLSANDAGEAFAVWHQGDSLRDNIWASHFVPVAGWGAPVLIDTANGDARGPQIALDPAGNAVAVWVQYDGTRSVLTANDYTRDNSGVPDNPVETIFDLSAHPKDAKLDLLWTPVAGAEGYNVYRSTTPGGPYELLAHNYQCDYCAYADFGLTNGVTYYYVVTSLSGGVESLPSNEASATPQLRSRTR